ncbi:hypothetical protein WA026_015190 [Henosepilachna vigintioctopunctata]|uniref:Uncharacterized protein n=1 Tax=Henosepilachna vigintioctopunctata TaxID=420089 RepID=A0AAW1TUZ0_9CUCU
METQLIMAKKHFKIYKQRLEEAKTQLVELETRMKKEKSMNYSLTAFIDSKIRERDDCLKKKKQLKIKLVKTDIDLRDGAEALYKQEVFTKIFKEKVWYMPYQNEAQYDSLSDLNDIDEMIKEAENKILTFEKKIEENNYRMNNYLTS